MTTDNFIKLLIITAIILSLFVTGTVSYRAGYNIGFEDGGNFVLDLIEGDLIILERNIEEFNKFLEQENNTIQTNIRF